MQGAACAGRAGRFWTPFAPVLYTSLDALATLGEPPGVFCGS
jgi:hypothetical protein